MKDTIIIYVAKFSEM